MPENGTQVIMKATHPHARKVGFIRLQPGENNSPLGMYLIEGDGPYEGNWYAEPHDFTVVR